MRQAIVVAVLAIGCTETAVDDPPAPADPADPGGGLPTRTCGAPGGDTVGCSVFTPLCFGWARNPLATAGDCVSPPGDGTLAATLGGSALVASQVAAVVNGAYVEVSAQLGEHTLVLLAPATPGTYACATGRGIAASTDARYRNFGELAGCTITVTATGDVGQRIDGTFAGTLLELGEAARTLEVTNGTFSIERMPY